MLEIKAKFGSVSAENVRANAHISKFTQFVDRMHI